MNDDKEAFLKVLQENMLLLTEGAITEGAYAIWQKAQQSERERILALRPERNDLFFTTSVAQAAFYAGLAEWTRRIKDRDTSV